MGQELAALVAVTVLVCGASHFSGAQAQERQCPGGRARIVGGETARFENWPGQAAIRLRSEGRKTEEYICGGTAITDRWILSAAHCFENYLLQQPSGQFEATPTTRDLEVVLGSGDLSKTTPDNTFHIERIVMHERYRYAKASVGDDIALVRLARPWSGPVAGLSLSPVSDPVTPPSTQVRVAGFGLTEHNMKTGQLDKFDRADGRGKVFAGSVVLLETAIETIATPQCQRIMTERYPDSKIGAGHVCAGLEQGQQDSCKGDSGGPLVVTDVRGCPWQIGVVSWGGWPCAQKQDYGVYTRVSHFADWIQKHTGPLRGAPTLPVQTAGHALTPAQFDEGLRHLETLLGSAKGRVSIGVRGGNRVRLGDKVAFEATSDLAGKLIILDINANREVLTLYPNKFVSAANTGSIAAGQRVTVPGPDYPGFTAFQATEPTGKGRLLALVVPPDFDIERFVAEAARMERGFQPANDPPSFLMRVIRQIETALSSRARSSGDDELKRWGYAMAEYEIVAVRP